MELWIRSQDKMKLIPINDELYIPNSRTGEDFGVFYRETMLGYYKTKERTLEVLDEIQNIIYINKLFNADINAFKKSLEIEGYTEKEISKALKTISTYEMPKE